MAIPIAEEIKRCQPSDQVLWICGDTSAPIVKICDHVDETLVINEKNLLKGSFLLRAIEIFRIWKFILVRKPRKVYILHSDWRYRILSPLPWLTKLLIPRKGEHHTLEYMRGVSSKDLSNQHSVQYNFRLSADHFEEFDVILVPAGAKNTLREDILRRWPVESYVNLSNLLISKGFKVAIIGGKDDVWVSSLFSPEISNFIGLLKIEESLRLIKKCKILVSHDTGPMHLGSLAQVPVISLFGPTDYKEKMPLTNSKSEVISNPSNLSCSPCYDGKNYSKTCKEPLCLMAVRPEHIFKIIIKKLEK